MGSVAILSSLVCAWRIFPSGSLCMWYSFQDELSPFLGYCVSVFLHGEWRLYEHLCSPSSSGLCVGFFFLSCPWLLFLKRIHTSPPKPNGKVVLEISGVVAPFLLQTIALFLLSKMLNLPYPWLKPRNSTNDMIFKTIPLIRESILQ